MEIKTELSQLLHLQTMASGVPLFSQLRFDFIIFFVNNPLIRQFYRDECDNYPIFACLPLRLETCVRTEEQFRSEVTLSPPVTRTETPSALTAAPS